MRYAVKLGEIELRMERPITLEDRKQAIERVLVAHSGAGEKIQLVFKPDKLG